MHLPGRFAVMLLAFCFAAFTLPAVAEQPADEQPVAEASDDGSQMDRAALVRVRLPLVGSADQAVRNSIGRACEQLIDTARRRGDLRRPVLVLQLEPPVRADEAGEGSQFERAVSVARYLCSSDLAGVRKVAFAPNSIRGHSTLLAMACEELIMAPDAEIGDAGIDEPSEDMLRQTMVAAYREIAEARPHDPHGPWRWR